MAAAFRIFFYLIVTCLSALLMYSYIMTNSNAEDYYDVNISKLKSIIATMVDELVPFDIHEFKILSWKLEFTKSAKNITTGYLSTIFQEQLFAFAMIGSEGKRILRVESQQKSFSLFEEEGNTKVFLSEELIGTIGGDNIFTSLDGNCTYTISQALSDTVTISSKDEEIAEVYVGNDADPVSDRFFRMIHDQKILDDEKFLAVVLFIILLKK